MKGLIRRKLSEFISERTLSDFLAAINVPELEQQIQEEVRLQQSGDELAGVTSERQQFVYETPTFTSRSELTDIFYDFASNFTRSAGKIGVEMRWIGVGTWVTPDEIIPEQHVNAWRITRENISRGGKQALESLEQQSRDSSLVGLIQEIITISNQQIVENVGEDDKAIQQIMESYRSRLRTALDIYEQREGINSPEARQLRRVLEHLARVAYRWLGDANG
jgi:hypothetical protein